MPTVRCWPWGVFSSWLASRDLGTARSSYLAWVGPVVGSTSVASVATSGVLVAASGVVCGSTLFSLEIAESTKLLTSDGARTKASVSWYNRLLLSDNNTRRSACKAGLLMLRMSVGLTRVTRVVLPNTLYMVFLYHEQHLMWSNLIVAVVKGAVEVLLLLLLLLLLSLLLMVMMMLDWCLSLLFYSFYFH